MKYLFIPMILLVGLLSSSVFAIDVQFNKFTQNLRYESLESAILTNPYTGKRDKWGFTLGYSFVEDPLGRGRVNTTLTPVISDLYSVQFGLNFALSERVEIMLNSAFHSAQFNILGEDDSTFGDTTLALKYQFLKRKSFAMAITPYAILPTGDEDLFLGGESAGYGVVLSVEKDFKRFGAVLNFGYTNTQDNIEQNIDYENLYHLGVGIRVPIKRFAIQAEYRVNFTDENSEQRPNELHLGASYQVSSSLRAFASYGLGNSDTENNNDFRLLAGLKGSFGAAPIERPVIEDKVEEVVKKLELVNHINFKTASSEILPSSFSVLDDAVKVILKNKQYIKSILIEGHTDSMGDRANNQRLSEGRANSVSAYFYKAGVDKDILDFKGFGETRLKIDPEKTAQDRAQNRRVEFVVVGEILEKARAN